jgi:hypothetical protein
LAYYNAVVVVVNFGVVGLPPEMDPIYLGIYARVTAQLGWIFNSTDAARFQRSRGMSSFPHDPPPGTDVMILKVISAEKFGVFYPKYC